MIVDRLQKPCWINKKVHSCLDEFRADPKIVLTWQVLWRSLPAWRRRETLLALYRARGNTADADGDADSLLMPFLGKRVCRRAFMALTGIGSYSLSKARSDAARNARSSLSSSDMGSCLLIKGAVDLTLLMTFKDQLVMTLKMRSAIAFVHAVFTCDQ